MDRRQLRRERAVMQRLLRDVRQEAELSQQEVAERLEVPQSFVSKYESGERRLDILELRRICAACNVPLQTFLERFETMLSDIT